MNKALIQELIARALRKQITFLDLLAALANEGVESYHVDFLRNELRYYATNGESLVLKVALAHDDVAAEFSAERLQRINQRVQSGGAGYADFVREAPAAGCAFYIVYLNGKKVRYFGRDGGEYIQDFPAPR
jgi:uncharacterized protein YbcV (DUF1398 family)